MFRLLYKGLVHSSVSLRFYFCGWCPLYCAVVISGQTSFCRTLHFLNLVVQVMLESGTGLQFFRFHFFDHMETGLLIHANFCHTADRTNRRETENMNTWVASFTCVRVL